MGGCTDSLRGRVELINPLLFLPLSGAARADTHSCHGRKAPGPEALRPVLRPDGLQQCECSLTCTRLGSAWRGCGLSWGEGACVCACVRVHTHICVYASMCGVA